MAIAVRSPRPSQAAAWQHPAAARDPEARYFTSAARHVCRQTRAPSATDCAESIILASCAGLPDGGWQAHVAARLAASSYGGPRSACAGWMQRSPASARRARLAGTRRQAEAWRRLLSRLHSGSARACVHASMAAQRPLRRSGRAARTGGAGPSAWSGGAARGGRGVA